MIGGGNAKLSFIKHKSVYKVVCAHARAFRTISTFGINWQTG